MSQHHRDHEDVLRRALHSAVDSMEVSGDGLERIQARLTTPRPAPLAWVMAAPQMLFIPDKNADGVPDGPAEVVLDGFASTGGNKHTTNCKAGGPDCILYVYMTGPMDAMPAEEPKAGGTPALK